VRFVGYDEAAFVLPLADGARRPGRMPSFADLARRASMSLMAGGLAAGGRAQPVHGPLRRRPALDVRDGCGVALISLTLIGGTPRTPREIGPVEAWIDRHLD
jgi:hypothetical protein